MYFPSKGLILIVSIKPNKKSTKFKKKIPTRIAMFSRPSKMIATSKLNWQLEDSHQIIIHKYQKIFEQLIHCFFFKSCSENFYISDLHCIKVRKGSILYWFTFANYTLLYSSFDSINMSKCYFLQLDVNIFYLNKSYWISKDELFTTILSLFDSSPCSSKKHYDKIHPRQLLKHFADNINILRHQIK